ncbi:Fe-S protein assembly co-chaperone HscB [Psychrobacter lutiphocae]|uniref:Fe-S protein assembly co-chaperone HscB n=1 Tax=Psychrobacter lutiphocae TaxID=540500 RepID=UPI000371D73C|nr:Fe-S protein assembly co-chaperone HscB [Psychrobacter lutiphocae]
MSDNAPTFANFFALFELPIAFDIDQKKLGERLRLLQQQYHPDQLNLQHEPAKEQTSTSQQTSALINHAYDILSHEDSRANYLLELSGQSLNTDLSIADFDFLDDAMEMRIALDDASLDADFTRINELKSKVDQRLAEYSQKFKVAYADQDWTVAMDATQKLKFLVKLKKDMDTAIDVSKQQTQQDDDDLYL